ncbi:MAG: RAMP superfamily CRISPR-associated protein [Spirochaetaceae bacterium]|nr:RAMP superfamily CRISPR-associated protein [Spirochaetaceae bacterium]
MNPQRLDLSYRIAWQGRWHVGSGYQSATADRHQRRWGGDGRPFVPGSQIKGVLRHQCERLAVALNLDTVDPHAGTKERGLRLTQHFQPLAKSSLLIDRLFGTRYQGECLFVTNALPLDSDRCSETAIAARTAIDRVTGTVMERHLFTTELADGEIDLRGQIRARHAAGVLTQDDDDFPYEYSLLTAGLLSLDTFGGDKSVGMGRCKMSIEPESLRWNDREMALPAALKSFEDPDWADMIGLLREDRS